VSSTPVELLARLRLLGVRPRVVAGALHLDDPDGRIDGRLQAELTRNEAAIVALFTPAASAPEQWDRAGGAWQEGMIGPFLEQVRRAPTAVAVVAADRQVTYGELHYLSRRIAGALRGEGAGPGDLVGIVMPRGPEAVAALLGVLGAGAAYLPLDPEWPRLRLAALLAEARPVVVVTGPDWSDRILAAGGRPLPLSLAVGAVAVEALAGGARDDLAYVVYPSGSTGAPKGVMIEHGGVLGILAYLRDAFRLGPDDVVLSLSPLTFDASVREIFAPLAVGARLVMEIGATVRDPAAVLETVRRRSVSCLLAVTPTRLRELAREADRGAIACPSVRLVMFTGERLFATDCRAARRLFPSATLVNQYGPTETTMVATYHVVGAEDEADDLPVPIGRPIPGRRVLLVDDSLKPVPEGVAGEVVLGGEGVARGYLPAADQVTPRFLPDRDAGCPRARLYRTGDRGRLRKDGSLEFLGRLDREVKVAGVRVAPEEVESALRSHAGVREAVVVPATSDPNGVELVAYVVAAPSVVAEELRRHAAARLPAVMVPTRIVTRASLPRTSSGKVDLAALAAEAVGGAGDEAPAQAPSVSDVVAAVWGEVLGIDRVAPQTDFFAAGGHSLLAMQLLARLRRRLGVDVPVRTIFEAATVAQFTQAVETLLWLREQDGDAPPPPAGEDRS
jgi:amino acid adenylation domain-containing protein